MKNTLTTIASAGRLVLPKNVRDEAVGITAQEGKIEVEPVPREVRIVQRGPLRIAVPVEEGPSLTADIVQRVRRDGEHGD